MDPNNPDDDPMEPDPGPPKPIEPTEGWVYLINSPRFHYMRNGKSLCRKWGYFGSTFEAVQGGFEKGRDCVACFKRLQLEIREAMR